MDTPTNDTPTNEAPPPPRRRLRRVLLIVVLSVFVVAVLLIASLPTIISSNLSGWIEASVNDLEGKVELDTTVVSWTGNQSIEGLRLLERLPDGTSRTVLSVKRAVIGNSLLDIVRGGSSPITVEIDEPVARVHRGADGVLNWERLLGVERSGDDGAPSGDGGRDEPLSSNEDNATGLPDQLSWNVERPVILRVRDGRVSFRDDALSTAADLESLTAELEARPESVRAELSASARPGDAEAPAGELRFSASATGLARAVDPAKLSAKAEAAITEVDLRPYRGLLEELTALQAPAEPVDGRFTVEMREKKLFSEIDLDAGFLALLGPRLPEGLELGQQVRASITDVVLEPSLAEGSGSAELTGDLRYQGYRVSRVTTNFEISERQVRFYDVKADLNGGRLVAPRVSLDLGGDKPGFEFELGLEGVEANYDTSRLLAYVVPFLSLEERRSALSGSITASLKLRGRGFALEDLVDTLTGEGELRIRDGKFEGSRFFHEVARLVGTDLDRVAFSELGSDFRLSSGEIASDNVFLTAASDKLRNLGLKGTTTLRGELDYGVDLAAIEETVGDKKIREILRGVSSVLGKDGVPIRLQGTLSAPRVAWTARAQGETGETGKGAGSLLDTLLGK